MTKRKHLLLTAALLTTASAQGTRTASKERRLQQHKHRTLSAWRSNNNNNSTRSSIRPLDLKLDESDPSKVYQVGAGGFLEPYDFENYQRGSSAAAAASFGSSEETSSGGSAREGPALSTSNSLHEDGGNEEGVVHHQSDRMERTNFDLNRWGALMGWSDVERRLVDGSSDEEAPPNINTGLETNNKRRVVVLSHKDIFKYTQDNDPYDIPDDQEDRDTINDTTTTTHQETTTRNNRNLGRKKNDADRFVTKADTEAPIIRSTFPPVNTKIGPNQSFGALVSDGNDGSGIKSVCLQLRDHLHSLSDCFELVNVATDVYELTFDGFDAYEGETWSYRVRSKDAARNRVNTQWADFIINVSGKGGGEDDSDGGGENQENNEGGESVKLTQVVNDESWPYGGVVQKSTGRILFFFDGNAYVCTGTVLDDKVEDRTVILTAAHCAYQYRPQGGRFAEHALFIPDQDSTTGSKSDEICSNDPYGCWIPAFAVVDYRWTQQGFPNSVPYDYAFYVIPNDASAHERGYLNGVSDLLPEVSKPLLVDWHYNHYGGDFTTGLGYSFDKDPDFRYCAGDMSTKFGIKTYENLWIDACTMTGGSSGGPWMVGTQTDGTGTVVSVNSWGYTSSSGMAGPNLSTGEAKCMYERAKTRSLYDYGGYIVTDCANS